MVIRQPIKVNYYISSSNYIVGSMGDESILKKKKIHQKKQVASLTKVMTCLTALRLAERLCLNLASIYITMPRRAKVRGTTANLKVSDRLNLEDLLYGMMLPSGNDASQLMAEGLGKILLEGAREEIEIESDDPNYVGVYLEEMGRVRAELGLRNTKFACVHGLANKENVSSVGDMLRLCQEAMKDERFRSIVSTKQYKAQVRKHDGRVEEYVWLNTNKLLEEGFTGIKTGQNEAAGQCLAASKVVNGVEYVVVLLNSEKRFEDAKRLLSF